MLRELQAIVSSLRGELATARLPVIGVADHDAADILGPFRGRRILIGLYGQENAMVVLGYSDKACESLVSGLSRRDQLDLSEAQVNELLGGFCSNVIQKAGKQLGAKGAVLCASPAVVIRASVAVSPAGASHAESAMMKTARGDLSVTVVMRPSRVDKLVTRDGALALVVDDDAFAAKLLGRILTGMGLEVVTAVDGEDALKKFEQQKPSLVLLDFEMPGMDGQACLEQFKSRAPHVPVVMVTGKGTEHVVRKCLASGASGFVVKPYNLDDVRRHIAPVLKHMPARMEKSQQ
jgi:CheY-like chemotaxis protein